MGTLMPQPYRSILTDAERRCWRPGQARA